MKRNRLGAIFGLGAMMLALPLVVQAAMVGRFSQVVGQVDLLKAGRSPALIAKVQDGVEPGDVIRTKSGAKATVSFVDDTTLIIAPKSRVAINEYIWDPARSQRRALLRVFRGLAHTVVTHIFPSEIPEFTLQTFTAVIGVRGTEWYTLIKPNSTEIYNIRGLLTVRSSNPEIPAARLLKALQSTQVLINQTPFPARAITTADLEMLRRYLNTGVPESAFYEPGPPAATPRPTLRPGVSPEERIQPTIPPVTIPVSPHGISPSGPSGHRHSLGP
jgi:hypothetical protein